MYELLWKIPEALYRHSKRPKLIVEELGVQQFRHLEFTPSRWGRYIIAKITNIGGRRAENCLAQILKVNEQEREFKLHWCGESWEYKRDSAPKIDLEPTESRELDIAFSYCGDIYPDGPSGVTNPPIPHFNGVRGVWVATPYVVENFEEDSDAYLEPGRHKVEIRIILSEGEGFVMNFIIESTENPSEINIDKKSIQPGAIDEK
ncbi:MAG: hypothetical protein ACFFCW_30095 [Candidatus Hodarchaeota archaeon]